MIAAYPGLIIYASSTRAILKRVPLQKFAFDVCVCYVLFYICVCSRD